MLRAARREGTPLGKKAEQYMNAGKLVPDEVVIGLVEERLQQADAKPGFILDGFPRTIPQAEALDGVLDKLGRAPIKVVDVAVPEAMIIERLSGRLSCPKCGAAYHVTFTPPKQPGVCDACATTLVARADDQPEAVAERLREYHEKTAPLVAYYEKAGVLKTIDGVGEPEVVLDRLVRALEN
jgi:adenylate kinase